MKKNLPDRIRSLFRLNASPEAWRFVATANGELRTANCAAPHSRRSAFTLIEMLVVVVIIGILAGIVFKLIGAGGASSDRARTQKQLEMLANAIEEYRAEYGKYPPVSKNQEGKQPVRYEYPRDPNYWTGGGKNNAKNLATKLKDVPRDEATVFVFGLMSYLECRVEGRASNAYRSLFEKSSAGIDQSHWLSENSKKTRADANSSDWNIAADSPRDIRAARRIEPYISKIRGDWEQERKWQGECWTNKYDSVWDAWSHELRYQSDPPYDSYSIWSIGPDGKDGTADDVYPGSEN